MERYNNYHKHDHISNMFTPDTNTHMIDYVNRALELNEPNVWTTNHGSGGDIFEANTLCEKNNLNAKFGIEGYIVPNPLEKDARNYHIIIIPKTNIYDTTIPKIFFNIFIPHFLNLPYNIIFYVILP